MIFFCGNDVEIVLGRVSLICTNSPKVSRVMPGTRNVHIAFAEHDSRGEESGFRWTTQVPIHSGDLRPSLSPGIRAIMTSTVLIFAPTISARQAYYCEHRMSKVYPGSDFGK